MRPIVSAFMWPEEHRVVRVARMKDAPKPEVQFSPVAGRNGTGLAVFGSF